MQDCVSTDSMLKDCSSKAPPTTKTVLSNSSQLPIGSNWQETMIHTFWGFPCVVPMFHGQTTKYPWSVPPGVHLLLVQMPPYLRRWQSTFQSVPGIGVQFPQSRCALQKQWFEAILLVLNSSNQGINSCYQLLNFYWCKDLSFKQRAGRHFKIKIWKNEKENWENWNVEKIPG